MLICERIFSSNKLFKLPSYIHGVACFYTYSNILFFLRVRTAQRLVLSNVQSLSFSVSSSSQLTVDDDRPVALPNSIFANLPTCMLTARLRDIFIQAIVEVIADPCMDFLRTSMHGQNPGRISSVQSPLFGLIACCQSMNHDYTLLRLLVGTYWRLKKWSLITRPGQRMASQKSDGASPGLINQTKLLPA